MFVNVQDVMVTASAVSSTMRREVETDNSDACVTDTVLSDSLPDDAEKRE